MDKLLLLALVALVSCSAPQVIPVKNSQSTSETVYLDYCRRIFDKIEGNGNRHFPQVNGKKLYGEVIILIPLYQDGTIYAESGGLRVRRSSGNTDLDVAALNIVQMSTPFEPIPQDLRSSDKEDVFEITVPFKFEQVEESSNNGSKRSLNSVLHLAR